jgi:hypothetical protein
MVKKNTLRDRSHKLIDSSALRILCRISIFICNITCTITVCSEINYSLAFSLLQSDHFILIVDNLNWQCFWKCLMNYNIVVILIWYIYVLHNGLLWRTDRHDSSNLHFITQLMVSFKLRKKDLFKYKDIINTRIR